MVAPGKNMNLDGRGNLRSQIPFIGEIFFHDTKAAKRQTSLNSEDLTRDEWRGLQRHISGFKKSNRMVTNAELEREMSQYLEDLRGQKLDLRQIVPVEEEKHDPRNADRMSATERASRVVRHLLRTTQHECADASGYPQSHKVTKRRQNVDMIGVQIDQQDEARRQSKPKSQRRPLPASEKVPKDRRFKSRNRREHMLAKLEERFGDLAIVPDTKSLALSSDSGSFPPMPLASSDEIDEEFITGLVFLAPTKEAAIREQFSSSAPSIALEADVLTGRGDSTPRGGHGKAA